MGQVFRLALQTFPGGAGQNDAVAGTCQNHLVSKAYSKRLTELVSCAG
jgi:hypothetical protein